MPPPPAAGCDNCGSQWIRPARQLVFLVEDSFLAECGAFLVPSPSVAVVLPSHCGHLPVAPEFPGAPWGLLRRLCPFRVHVDSTASVVSPWSLALVPPATCLFYCLFIFLRFILRILESESEWRKGAEGEGVRIPSRLLAKCRAGRGLDPMTPRS